MTRRAFNSPISWKQNLLLTLAMGSAAVLLGCGGGGGGNSGGGGGAGDCGDTLGTGTWVCGFVTNSGTGAGVNNVTVRLRDNSGNTLASSTTVNDVSSGAAGFYKIPVASGPLPTLISVDTPSTGFVPGYLQYKNKTYVSTQLASSGVGPCVPAVTIIQNADTRLLDKLILFSDSSAPPPPVFNCPR